MKKIVTILLMFMTLSLCTDLHAQGRKTYTLYDTINIKSGTKKYKLYRIAMKWLEEERGTKLVGKNRKQRQLAGKGYFPYYPYIPPSKQNEMYISPRANERTVGTVAFTIEIHIQDSIIVVRHSNFYHQAAFSQYGSLSFKLLMDLEKVPPNLCMEQEEWCNAIWADLKLASKLEVKDRLASMIPALLIRKRSFKIRDEVIADTTDKAVDPSERLKFEQYIIRDKKEVPKPVIPVEPKLDENGDPIDPELSGDEAAVDADTDSNDEGYGEEDSDSKKKKKGDEDEDAEPAGMIIGGDEVELSKKEKKKLEKEQAKAEKEAEKKESESESSSDSEADSGGDDYEDDEPAKSEKSEAKSKEKTKKSKPAKAKKAKKSKKPAKDEYDDYDDYDDYDED